MGKQGFRDTETNVYVSQEVSGGNSWAFGIDNTANDSWKLSSGGIIGTSDTFVMSTTGNRTMPLQSCFLVYASSIPNVVGNSSPYGPIVFPLVAADQGGDYDNTTGIYTAPIDGKYLLSTYVDMGRSFFPSPIQVTIDIITTARTYRVASFNGGVVVNSNNQNFGMGGAVLADMSASDTAYVQCKADTGGASSGRDVFNSHFSGGLFV
jgi:hypothetical protein